MKAPLKGQVTLVARTEGGQPSLEAVYASCREPVNRIDASLMTVTNREKALASLAFSATF
jgi:hypothetical protein